MGSEYISITVRRPGFDALQSFARDGWELVAVADVPNDLDNVTFHFKRPLTVINEERDRRAYRDKAMTNPAVVKQMVGEIAAMEYSGDMRAIAAVMIDKDGDVRTVIAYNEGCKLPIIAGVSILQSQLLSEARACDMPKPRDI